MTNSAVEEIEKLKKKYGLILLTFIICDAIALKKSLERANPSIVVLEKGTTNKKSTINDTKI
jgi:hypothetical protein